MNIALFATIFDIFHNIEQLFVHLLAFNLKIKCTWDCCGRGGKEHRHLGVYYRLIGLMWQHAGSTLTYRHGVDEIETYQLMVDQILIWWDKSSSPIWQYFGFQSETKG